MGKVLLSAVAMVAAAIGCMSSSQVLAAENYPSRFITMVVPWPAGGATDTNARLFAQAMSKELNQQVIVENKPGAGGSIGGAVVAKSAPDGYTLAYISSTNVTTSLTVPTPTYGMSGDLSPVVLTISEPLLLLVSPGIRANTVAALIDELKQKQAVFYGSTGTGGLLHIAGANFLAKVGLKGVDVQYKGTAPAIVDLLGDHIQILFGTFSDAYPLVKAGKLRALAITAASRTKLLPDVPTVSEALGSEDSERGTWQGILVPQGTPAEIVNILADSINKALGDPVMRERMTEKGLEPNGGGPKEFEARIQRELDIRRTAIRNLGIQMPKM